MIRILVVDDSATARTLLVSILAADPAIQVVGEASDGLEAIALTQKLRPDLVTMDLHMPRLDGLEATKEIMITAPTPIESSPGPRMPARSRIRLTPCAWAHWRC